MNIHPRFHVGDCCTSRWLRTHLCLTPEMVTKTPRASSKSHEVFMLHVGTPHGAAYSLDVWKQHPDFCRLVVLTINVCRRRSQEKKKKKQEVTTSLRLLAQAKPRNDPSPTRSPMSWSTSGQPKSPMQVSPLTRPACWKLTASRVPSQMETDPSPRYVGRSQPPSTNRP